MKIKLFKLFGTLVILVIAASAATALVILMARAHSSVAGEDLGHVSDSQTVALSDSGYASSVAELVSVTTEHGNPFPTRPGRSLIVVASTDRQHFVAATRLPDGTMRIRSDEHLVAIACTSYTPTCIGALTTDPSLINATPPWETY